MATGVAATRKHGDGGLAGCNARVNFSTRRGAHEAVTKLVPPLCGFALFPTGAGADAPA